MEPCYDRNVLFVAQLQSFTVLFHITKRLLKRNILMLALTQPGSKDIDPKLERVMIINNFKQLVFNFRSTGVISILNYQRSHLILIYICS